VIHEGDELSIDGTTGEVFAGTIPTVEAKFADEAELVTLLGWADGVRKLGVWANADYPRDATRAVQFGAEGIGLCRTEHMFFEEERLPIVRQMILAAGEAKRVRQYASLARDEASRASGEKRAEAERKAAAAEAELQSSE